MPRIHTTITDKQSGKKEEPKTKTTVRQKRIKFILLDQDENIVATLIDKSLAEKWVADRKMGAVKIIEENLVSTTKGNQYNEI